MPWQLRAERTLRGSAALPGGSRWCSVQVMGYSVASLAALLATAGLVAHAPLARADALDIGKFSGACALVVLMSPSLQHTCLWPRSSVHVFAVLALHLLAMVRMLVVSNQGAVPLCSPSPWVWFQTFRLHLY